MRILFILAIVSSIAGFSRAIADFSLLSPPIAAYVDNVLTWWGCSVANAIGLPTSGQSTSYNTVILSFWISDGTPSDAISIWADPTSYIPDNCGYGSDTQSMQQGLLNAFHNAGVNVIVSAFGSTDYPTQKDPVQTCTALAQFVLNNNLDGVDLDYEDSNAFDSNGTGENWLIQCTQTLRQYLPQDQYILTHAPQGPYFTTADLYPQGAYLKIDSQVGNMIDWYNLQYYNQGADSYVSYGDLFVSCSDFPGTAVLQLKTQTKYGIAVGKPVTTQDASDGWVDPGTLVSWFQQAHSNNGWCGGAMYWEFASDNGGNFGNTLKSGLQQISQSCSF